MLGSAYWVKWIDAATAGGHEWRTSKDMNELKAPIIEFVGFIHREEKEYIVFVGCKDYDPKEEDKSYWGELAIPRGCILEMRELRAGRKKKV